MLSIRKATAVVDGRAGIETSEEPDQARDNGPQDVPYKEYVDPVSHAPGRVWGVTFSGGLVGTGRTITCKVPCPPVCWHESA